MCSPSRAALLTGRYQQRFGHEFNPHSEEWEAQAGFGLPKTEKILPQYLKPLGYRSGMVGKWHLGYRDGYHPLDRGFDEYFGFLGGASDYAISGTKDARALEDEGIPKERKHPVVRGKQEVRELRYLTDAFSEEACSFIERNPLREPTPSLAQDGGWSVQPSDSRPVAGPYRFFRKAAASGCAGRIRRSV